MKTSQRTASNGERGVMPSSRWNNIAYPLFMEYGTAVPAPLVPPRQVVANRLPRVDRGKATLRVPIIIGTR